MGGRRAVEGGKGSDSQEAFADSRAVELNADASVKVKSRDKKKGKKKDGHADSPGVVDRYNGESNIDSAARKEDRGKGFGNEVEKLPQRDVNKRTGAHDSSAKMVHGKKKIKKLRRSDVLDTAVQKDSVNASVVSDELAKKKKKRKKNKDCSGTDEFLGESNGKSVARKEASNQKYGDNLGEQSLGDINKHKKDHGLKRNKVLKSGNDHDGPVEKDLVSMTLVNVGEGEKPSKKEKKRKRKRVEMESKEKKHKHDGEATEKLKRNKKHKNRERKKDNLSPAEKDFHIDGSGNYDKIPSDELEHHGRDKKRRKKVVDVDSANTGDTLLKKQRDKKIVKDANNSSAASKSNKKVRFSDEVQIHPIPVTLNDESIGEDGLLRGKRFTKEEDEIVKQAVYDYIEEHNLGENGLEMVLNCRKHPEAKGCWKEIGLAIPYRPKGAIYYRAQILFRRSETHKWTEEEYQMLLNHQKEHGNEWKSFADEIGMHRFHVKDTWRRIKLQNTKKGHWSQEEYQKLFDLVNVDLQKKVSEEKLSKHGMLRDNICWTAISDVLETRSQPVCCIKWYDQLTSPMVAQGLWSDADDYRLLTELYTLDANCLEDVNWDDLIEHRSGDICRKRWNQMVLHIGHHGIKSFAEQVEVLAQRYCPQLLEARDIWDSKPRVR